MAFITTNKVYRNIGLGFLGALLVVGVFSFSSIAKAEDAGPVAEPVIEEPVIEPIVEPTVEVVEEDVLPTPPTDTDGDGVADDTDNCVDVANPDQVDVDDNGVGDACDEGEDTKKGDETGDVQGFSISVPKVDICHATENGQYNLLNIAWPAVFGHTGPNHTGVGRNEDIIPPFGAYPGKNWDDEGQAIWNNDCQIPPKTGTITIVKEVIGDSGLKFEFESDFGSFSLAHGQSTTTVVEAPGSYDVSEIVPEGWNYPRISCTNQAEGDDGEISISVEVDQEVTCTFTNSEEEYQCRVEIVSDTTNTVEETLANAVATYSGHPAWTALIPGATWIWNTFHVDAPTTNETFTFKKTFTVEGINDATLSIAADNSYEVFINTNNVAIPTQGDENNFQVGTQDNGIDVTGLLNENAVNTIEVRVKNWALGGGTWENNPAGALYKLIVNSEVEEMCVQPAEEDDTTDVTICKYDDNDQSLPGWTVMLLGDKVGNTLNILPNGINVLSEVLTSGDPYAFIASGSYVYRPGNEGDISDAAFTKRSYTSDPINPIGHPYEPWVDVNNLPAPYEWAQGYLGITVDDAAPGTDWGTIFNSLHTYALGYTGTGTEAKFKILDDNYGDNSGLLNVDVYNGYVGITGDNGCVVFEDVPFGDYTLDEILQGGWTNLKGKGDEVTIDGESNNFSLINGEDGSGEQCVDEEHGWTDNMIDTQQGTLKNGSPITNPDRIDPNEAVGPADWVPNTGTNFYSLGKDGWITLSFDKFVPDVAGDDLSIHEGTNGQYPEEKAKVEVSQDGDTWFTLTEEASNLNPGNVSYLDFSESGFAWIKFVRITDTTNYALHVNDADGFDLDAVDATQELCEQPQTEDISDVTICKYENSLDGDLLPGWDVSLSPWVQDDFRVNVVLDNDYFSGTTGELGCITFTNVPFGSYRLDEIMKDGWVNVSGAGSEVVVDDSEETFSLVNAHECNPDVNLLANGGFENPVLGAGFWSIFPSGTPLLEWLTGSEGIEIQNNVAGSPHSGSQLAELDPNHPTNIWQSVATTPGNTYRLETYYSPRPGRDAEDNRFEIQKDGVALGASIARSGLANSNTDWSYESRTFVADTSTTDVGFAEIGTDTSYGAYLDDAGLYCVPSQEEQHNEVTICKYELGQQGPGLEGWTVFLKGDSVESDLIVDSTDINGTDSVSLDAGTSYLAFADGTWSNQGGANLVDSEYSTTDGWASQMDGYTGYPTEILELNIGGDFSGLGFGNWGAYNTPHAYLQGFTPSSTGPVPFTIFDGHDGAQDPSWFGDNSGTLSVDIFKGYTGITDETGCVTFNDVALDEYVVGEIMQDGWVQNVQSSAQSVNVDSNNGTYTLNLFNTNLLGSITIDKEVTGDGANGNLAFTFDPSWSDSNILLSANNPAEMISGLASGAYTITEIDDGADWALTDMSCTGGEYSTNPENNSVTVYVGENADVVCTFTNTYRHSDGGDDTTDPDEKVIVRKEVTEGSDTNTAFEFDASWYDGLFSLEASQEHDSGDLDVDTSYSVAEINVPSNWNLQGVSCTSSMPQEYTIAEIVYVIDPTDIVLRDGEIVTCVFTNDQTEEDDGGGSNGGGGSTSRRRGSSSSDGEVLGEVLGEQTSVLPIGAPNTGFGGLKMCLY